MDQSVTKFMKPAVALNPEVYELAAQTVLKGHCRFALARDAKEKSVHPEDLTAVTFCSASAIIKGLMEAEKIKFTTLSATVNEYCNSFGNFIKMDICHWNNLSGNTPEQIAAKFREFAKTL